MIQDYLLGYTHYFLWVRIEDIGERPRVTVFSAGLKGADIIAHFVDKERLANMMHLQLTFGIGISRIDGALVLFLLSGLGGKALPGCRLGDKPICFWRIYVVR